MITEQKRPASTELHYVAMEAIHQAWHAAVQQQTEVGSAHAHGRVKPGHRGPVRTCTAWIGRMVLTALISGIGSPAATVSALKPSRDFLVLIEDGNNCDLPGESNACVC